MEMCLIGFIIGNEWKADVFYENHGSENVWCILLGFIIYGSEINCNLFELVDLEIGQYIQTCNLGFTHLVNVNACCLLDIETMFGC